MRTSFKIVFFSFLMVSVNLFAQQGGEVLVNLQSMPLNNDPSRATAKSLLEVPFFDDFAHGKTAPSSDLWFGPSIFVNTTYAINSPSIGVATFDAYDNRGRLYPNASTFPFSADTLTSHPINLNYPGDTTVYFSFVFQPRGLGYQPNDRDSLVLEFYNNDDDEWEGAWAAWASFAGDSICQIHKLISDDIKVAKSDTLHKTFYRAHFPILDSRFLTGNFKFRFRNYATLQQNATVPGLLSNSDHWHIDQVYIDKGRTFDDTLLYDITFARPLGSILKNYESIPWKHFNSQARSVELTNPLLFTVLYRNLNLDENPAGRQVTRKFDILNNSTQDIYEFSSASDNIASLSDYLLTREYSYNFTSAWQDSAKYRFRSYLITEDSYPFRWNDTVRYTQQFKNYYAYDDGTAESGYGLYGEGTQNAQVALKYTTYKADTLVGVYMYFNRTKDDANQKYFKLGVWDDNNGKPGNLIYEQLGLRPQFADSLNRFVLFKINEELIIDEGTFYIGWIQTTTEMLNFGYDRNRNSQSKLFYNIEGNWTNTSFKGSLMLRPVFGKLNESPIHSPTYTVTKAIRIFPNPASDLLNIELPHPHLKGVANVYNLIGQQVLSVPVNGNPISVSSLANGTYIVRVVSNGVIVGTQKLVIAKW
ncbi:MAG: T9SS type A sorting domain-containing protein [Bacteroidales bacterium]|nr:T9SS type A sorting domain-containing protein [Bacteroidales bacterium]MDD3891198.1 T9SS type A sorting domain-containing protein [Bacteroidales bacterium]